MRHRLRADCSGGMGDRLPHHVGVPPYLRLSSHTLLRRDRLLGRDRLWHHVRLLCRCLLIHRVSLRHQRIYRRGGEHPCGDPYENQNRCGGHHQSHHDITQTEHNSPTPCHLRYVSP